MSKKFCMVLAVLFTAFHIQASALASEKTFVGAWKFNVSGGSYGYEQGTILISETDGKLTGEIKFADGEKIDMERMVVTDNVLTFRIWAQSGYVDGKATIEGNKFKGTAITPDGDIPFEAIRVEKK